MIWRVLGWCALLVVCAWTDLFLLPSLGASAGFWMSVVALSFAARGSSPAVGGLFGGVLGLVIGVASAEPAWHQVAAGAAAGALTARVAGTYVSHRSLLSAAATSFLCATVFWIPPVAVAAADTVRGGAGVELGSALAASVFQSVAAALVSIPFLLMRRSREARLHRPAASWL
ncbi:hypothetical protein EPO33_01480 [Patescibacteria group bacterium]|nr:MAG: hypothetical protein EPO33_01480 [Patescibacteria group bacterium]